MTVDLSNLDNFFLSRELFEVAINSTDSLDQLESVLKKIPYKKNFSKDEKGYRKDAINNKITWLKSLIQPIEQKKIESDSPKGISDDVNRQKKLMRWALDGHKLLWHKEKGYFEFLGEEKSLAKVTKDGDHNELIDPLELWGVTKEQEVPVINAGEKLLILNKHFGEFGAIAKVKKVEEITYDTFSPEATYIELSKSYIIYTSSGQNYRRESLLTEGDKVESGVTGKTGQVVSLKPLRIDWGSATIPVEYSVLEDVATMRIGLIPELIELPVFAEKTQEQEPKKIDSDASKPEKPVLEIDAPTAVILFAGGGGIEAGMVEAGIRPVAAVEFDPDNEGLSFEIANCHENNFSYYGCELIRDTVENLASQGFPGIPTPDFLHASPSCKNFSNASGKNLEEREQEKDINSAKAIASAIKILQPKKGFTLEQVPGYRHSESFEIICNCLTSEGYKLEWSLVNMADDGVTPQARNRLILRAGKQGVLGLPPLQDRKSWYSAIADLIPNLEESHLTETQSKAIDAFLADNKPVPLLLERVGIRDGECKIRTHEQPALTIKASIFTDDKGSDRQKFFDVWLPDGTTKSLDMKCIARLQGFPDWYEFPDSTRVAGAICGNSVPPSFAKLLFSQPITSDTVIEENGRSLLLTSAIRVDGGTQSRVKMDENVIRDYCGERKEGQQLPPIITFFDGQDYWLGDGFHRLEAEKLLGSSRIWADIREGSQRDAILFSVAANSNHGLRRTNADKRKAVETLLNDEEWRGWSNREIARRCAVDEGMVRKVRAELSADNPRDTRTVQRGGKTYEQKIAKKKEVFPRQVLISSDHPIEEIRGKMALATCKPNAQQYIVEVDGERHVIKDNYVISASPTLPSPPTSVTVETKLKAKELGVPYKGLPDAERNDGIPTEQHLEQEFQIQKSIETIFDFREELSEGQVRRLLESLCSSHKSLILEILMKDLTEEKSSLMYHASEVSV